MDRIFSRDSEKERKSKVALKELASYESMRVVSEVFEELYTRPYEDIAGEEFLESLPGPTIEEVPEPQASMDSSGSSKDPPADLPQGKMADPTKDVRMATRRQRKAHPRVRNPCLIFLPRKMSKKMKTKGFVSLFGLHK